MRTKIVLAAAVFVIAFVALSTLRTSTKAPPPHRDPAPRADTAGDTSPPLPAPSGKTAQAQTPATTPATNAVSLPEIHEQAVEKRSEELMALAMQDDAASLGTILTELDNADPGIRAAALQATIQFGSRDAIPRLMEAAQKTEDRQERRALEDAVEYLKLPSLTEVRAERRQLGNH